jgi:phenylacetic acid degradation operon negative regulatory protein
MLGGLIDLLAPFGINERLVRTSVFRLAREGWLKAKPIGRESLYRLTREGVRRFRQAYRRIYGPGRGLERVVGDRDRRRLDPAQRRALKQELQWEGFGTFGSGVLARPATAASAVPRIAAALHVERHIAVVRARDDAASAAARSPRSCPTRGTCGLSAHYRNSCAASEGHRPVPAGGQGRRSIPRRPSSSARC